MDSSFTQFDLHQVVNMDLGSSSITFLRPKEAWKQQHALVNQLSKHEVKGYMTAVQILREKLRASSMNDRILHRRTLEKFDSLLLGCSSCGRKATATSTGNFATSTGNSEAGLNTSCSMQVSCDGGTKKTVSYRPMPVCLYSGGAINQPTISWQ